LAGAIIQHGPALLRLPVRGFSPHIVARILLALPCNIPARTYIAPVVAHALVTPTYTRQVTGFQLSITSCYVAYTHNYGKLT